MAIFIHCPSCNQQLDKMTADCPHCGTPLPPGVLNSLSIALGETPSPALMTTPGRLPPHLVQVPQTQAPHRSEPQPDLAPPAQNSTLRPWLAATLSLLCGLGQLYNGQTVKGCVLIVLGGIALTTMHLAIVQFFIPVLWLYAVIDAYLVARRPSSLPAAPNRQTTNRR